MSDASKSASVLSIDEVVADLENALVKMKLLMKIEMPTKTTTNNIVNDATLLELNAKKSELRAFELTLEADRAEFEVAKAKLEDEKSKVRYAESQQKIAQSRMEDAISKFESAQAELEEARRELDKARAHLEAAKSQTLINNTRLEAAKASLEASKIRFEAATLELKDAKSKFEDAKTQLLEASSSYSSNGLNQAESYVKEYKAKNQQLEAEILNLKRMNEEESNKSQVELKKVKDDHISKLEDYKTKSEVAIKECRARIECLETEKSKLMNDKERLENELKESRRVRFAGVKAGNPVVFFDMKFRGAPMGRIVMELYADTNPRLAEIFRALCVGEKALPGTDRVVSYKGTDILYVVSGYYIQGGNVRAQNRAEFESIYEPFSAAEMSNSKANGPGELYLVIQYQVLGKYTCSFFINGSKGKRYNAPYPLIGKVIQGLDTVDARNQHYNIPNNTWLNEGEFVIADCGQL